jgi:hypothetical protein
MLVVAVPAAVLSAASFGLDSALQQRATKQVPIAAPDDPRLLVRLVRQPAWLLRVGWVAVGFALQVVALAFGPLVLVQPLLVTGVLFGTVFSAVPARCRIDGQILLGTTACVLGLAALLTLARPSDTGGELADLPRLIPLAVALAVIIVGCLMMAVVVRISGAAQVAALAMATGVLYGVTAGIVKVITGQLCGGGLVAVLGAPGAVGDLSARPDRLQFALLFPQLVLLFSSVRPAVHHSSSAASRTAHRKRGRDGVRFLLGLVDRVNRLSRLVQSALFGASSAGG